MGKYKKPDLGTDYSGIETIKKYVKEMQADYEHSVIEDILGYVLWILDDYKKMKQGDGTNFSRITKTPEALAEFVSKAEATYERCCNDGVRCDFCECQWCCVAGRSELIEWLKQESDTK